jgi:hypothetical protein
MPSGCLPPFDTHRMVFGAITTACSTPVSHRESVWYEGSYQLHIENLQRGKKVDANLPHRVAVRDQCATR